MQSKLKKVSAFTAFSIGACSMLWSAQDFENDESAFDEEDHLIVYEEELESLDEDFMRSVEIADSSEENSYSDDEDAIPQVTTRKAANQGMQSNPSSTTCKGFPLAGDPNCNGFGFFLTADALAWNVKEDGLAYTIKNKRPIDYSFNYAPTPNNHAQVRHFDFEWAAGFRVGVGYHFSPKKWDLGLGWTWYHQRTDAHSKAGADASLFAIWMAPTSIGSDTNKTNPYALCREAKAKWSLHYNVLDLDLGRNCAITRFFSIRPHGGVRSAWIHQNFDIDYIDLPGQPPSRTGYDKVDVKLKNAFWGWGIRGGIDTTWTLWKSWSLFGNAAYCLLWGNFHVTDKEIDFWTGHPSVLQADLKDNYHAFSSNFELAAGIRWDCLWDKDRYHLAFTLGWEELFWFNQNQLNHLNNGNNVVQFFKEHGDLGLSGFTFNVRFDF